VLEIFGGQHTSGKYLAYLVVNILMESIWLPDVSHLDNLFYARKLADVEQESDVKPVFGQSCCGCFCALMLSLCIDVAGC